MTTTRRGFMKGGALALVGTSAIPSFLERSVLAEATTAAANNKKLVVIFQRGAADGLNIVVPYRETNYYAMRPSIAIRQNGTWVASWPDDTATSLMPISSDSPSTYAKLMFKLFGRRCSQHPLM